VEPIVPNRLATGPVNVLGTTRSTVCSEEQRLAPRYVIREISYAGCGGRETVIPGLPAVGP